MPRSSLELLLLFQSSIAFRLTQLRSLQATSPRVDNNYYYY